MKTKQLFVFLIVLVTLFSLGACGRLATPPTMLASTPTPSIFELTSPTQLMEQVNALLEQGNCKDAMPIMNGLIKYSPDWPAPLEARVDCNLAFQSNVFTDAQGYLLAALRDLNTLIELQPTAGGYYAWRNYALRRMADLEVSSANKFAIYDLAYQDAAKAVELHVNPSSYAYRHYARNLIEGNHCQDGLAETQKLIDQATLQSDDFGEYYSLYLTEAYICLGEFDKALESAQSITCEQDQVLSCQTSMLIQIYFQSGDYENALDVINQTIDVQPAWEGWRYFIRALIYYEQGEPELASQDLEVGDTYTWYGNGVYWYVKAKFALDAGDKETGIAYLQNAEQTLDVINMPLRKQVIEELKSYGAEPIMQTANLPFVIPPSP